MALTIRQRQILDRLQGANYLEVKDLAGLLDVDVSTIRRDLQTLTRDGLVSRRHGGVMLKPGREVRGPQNFNIEARAVARAAHRLLRPGDIVFLAAGPISTELATMALDMEELTVVTNSLQVADVLGEHGQMNLRLAGGEVRSAGRAGLVCAGPETQNYLSAISADWAFVEVDGIHPYSGFTTSLPWLVSAQRAMVKGAEKVCVMAPSRAFGLRCVGFIQDVSNADLILTDDDLDDYDLPAFGGKVVRAAIETHDSWR